MKGYYATYRRNGTEDEFIIHRPNGDEMAFRQFWDEPDTNDGERAEKIVEHIVAALNAYKKPLRLPPRKMKQAVQETPRRHEVDESPIAF